MKSYRAGRDVEYAVIHALTEDGYRVSRGASSKGDLGDVQALKRGQLLIISCKRTRMPSPAERRQLLDVAALLPGVGVPLVALRPARQALQFRRLLGVGAKDWIPWTADEVGP